jgi:predicted nucleic acid-binding protein
LINIVIDASVFIDHLIRIKGLEERNIAATRVLNLVPGTHVKIFEPFILEIELYGVLVRYINKDLVKKIVNDIMNNVIVVGEDEIHEEAKTIAFETGSRAVDSYYIASALRSRSFLISSDKTMIYNAQKAGLKAYHLVEDIDKIIDLLKS